MVDPLLYGQQAPDNDPVELPTFEDFEEDYEAEMSYNNYEDDLLD